MKTYRIDYPPNRAVELLHSMLSHARRSSDDLPIRLLDNSVESFTVRLAPTTAELSSGYSYMKLDHNGLTVLHHRHRFSWVLAKAKTPLSVLAESLPASSITVPERLHERQVRALLLCFSDKFYNGATTLTADDDDLLLVSVNNVSAWLT